MKINEKNLLWWLLSPFIIAVIYFEISFFINDFRFFKIVNGVFICATLLFAIAYTAIEGVKPFEVDLFKPFKSRHISPEHQDKENKND